MGVGKCNVSRLGHLLGATVGGATAILLTSPAFADLLVQTQTVADAPSDIGTGVTFSKFDPSLGTLTGVSVNVTGDVNGTISYQSREAAPSTIDAGFNGLVTVSRPDTSPIISVAPSASTFANLAAFKGTIGGPSGGSAALSAAATASTSGPTLSAADQALFTGPGSITLPVTAQVRSFENGPANLAAQFQAKASASVGLTYNFAAPGQSGGGSSGGSVFTMGFNGSVPTLLAGSVTSAPQIRKIADQTTGWNDAIGFQKFNPALGALEEINLKLVSDVKAKQSFQNLGATATTVDGTQIATLGLALSGNKLLTVATTLNKFASLAGGAGITFSDLVGSDTAETSLIDNADLALFTGLDSILLDLSAIGTSMADGPGNMLLDFAEQAGATVDLTYTYLPSSDAAFVVPEPPTWLIFIGSLALSAAMARRRNLGLRLRAAASTKKQAQASTLEVSFFPDLSEIMSVVTRRDHAEANKQIREGNLV